VSDTITVTVRDQAAEVRAWGQPGLWSPILRTITLPRFTERGERRSDPGLRPYCEDGVWFDVSNWTLDSGRVETYPEALECARKAQEVAA